MEKDLQKKEPGTSTISPLAQEKTYGEKKYDLIFGTVIDFWVNLLASAGFAFFVVHSRHKIKLPFVEEAKPLFEYQDQFAGWLNKTFVMKTIKDDAARLKRSEAMASLFTLLTPGHFILIPSVWLGDKIKPAFVKYFDRKHYGDDAMLNPELIARHEAIEMADRHTLLGTLVGRIGTVFATQAVARTLGNEQNWANKIGDKAGVESLKKFGGMDPLAGRIGDLIGDDIERISPKLTGKVNDFFTRNEFSWSTTQMKNPNIDTSGIYNQSLQNFTRYVAQDVIYTLVSSGTIRPIINFAKKFLPGMTYKPAPKPGMDLETIEKIKVSSHPLLEEEDRAAAPTETPDARVTSIQPESTVHPRREAGLSYAGN